MTHQRISLPKIGSILLAAYLTTVPVSASQGGQVTISAGAKSMLQRSLGSEAAPAASGGGRHLFEAVLASRVFRHGQVGPFDVHVLMRNSGSAVKNAERDAEKVRDAVLLALAPASDLVQRLWPAGGEGLISATRFPVVIVTDRTDYLQIVALLDHCERAGYSGWAPGKMIDSSEARGAEFVQTWDVQVFDLTHPVIAERRDAWLKHGVGHYSLGFVTTRALQRGAWGVVPPWLSAGLTDELDIAAYGEAWVCQGWAGFLSKGQPPTPQAGVSADLAAVRETGKSWLARDASRTRHWRQLVADTKSRTSASFVPAADSDSLLPRDRAAARCLMHLLLQGIGGNPVLTSLLDRPVQTPAHGMLDSDPLPVIFARALGGIPEVDRLEALDTRALLTELGRQDLIERLEQSRAADALALRDHRAQSAWMYDQPAYDDATRNGLFQAFLEIEHLQQMAEWKALGPHLDSGLRSALKACKAFPTQDPSVAAVTQAFRVGLAKRADEKEAGAPSTKARGPSKGK